MSKNPELIVMLTHHDTTVKNAYELFRSCKDTKANIWGFKEKGLSLDEMKKLYFYMKECGKTTVLEVVAYTEKECIEGAKTAAICKCDILMGTCFFDSVNTICKENNIKYMPFVGKITGRPSVLNGSIDEMISEANTYLQKGVYGFDLLGYRYTGDPVLLNQEFTSKIKAPICLAGNINSFKRLDEIKKASPWAFTIGGAFFENKFNGSLKEQINAVYEYINK